MHDEKAQLQSQVQEASAQISELQGKVYHANKASLDLLNKIKDKETENESLKRQVSELKSRMPDYIPQKDERMNMKLAESITNQPSYHKPIEESKIKTTNTGRTVAEKSLQRHSQSPVRQQNSLRTSINVQNTSSTASLRQSKSLASPQRPKTANT